MKRTNFSKLLFLSTLSLFLSSGLWAQIHINSPYSRFGIGELNKNENLFSKSMGGLSYGMRSNHSINSKNPASYMAIDSGSFVFEAAYVGQVFKSTSALSSTQGNYMNLDYFKAAFPVTDWWRISLGLNPFSQVGYSVTSTETIDSIGDVEYNYAGDGGVSQLYWGNAFKLSKNLAFGINASYLFGDINYQKLNRVADNINLYSYRITSTSRVNKVMFDFGVQYTDTIGKLKEHSFTIGGVFSNYQKFNAQNFAFAETFLESTSGAEYSKDTLINNTLASSEYTLPLNLGFGFELRKMDEWSFGVDANYQDWSNFSTNSNAVYTTALSVNAGGMYKVGKVYLRMGLRYYNSYLQLNNTQINEIGISFGTSIPLRQNTRTFSFLNLGMELGTRGTTDNSLIRQDFINFSLGLSIRNSWFKRIRYQ